MNGQNSRLQSVGWLVGWLNELADVRLRSLIFIMPACARQN